MKMEPLERLKTWEPHQSIRGYFAHVLYQRMALDERIWCLTADLGYSMLDNIRDDFPDRYVNFGASEQLMIGAAVGLALEGRIPFAYSITTFLIYRPFEWIRNYVNHERIPVRLVGSGAQDDYKHDGITHQPWEIGHVMSGFSNIRMFCPSQKEEVEFTVDDMIDANTPAFICLRR